MHLKTMLMLYHSEELGQCEYVMLVSTFLLCVVYRLRELIDFLPLSNRENPPVRYTSDPR